MRGELLSKKASLKTLVNAAGIKAYEVDLTGTDNKLDAFYVDPTSLKKIITFVQLNSTITDPFVE